MALVAVQAKPEPYRFSQSEEVGLWPLHAPTLGRTPPQRPRVTRTASSFWWVAEVISGEATLEEVLVEGPVPGLMFLPSGRYPPNPSELLMRSEFSTLIKTLNSCFDLTICDTPPVLAVTDPVIIGRAVGATIAVVRYDETPIAEVLAMRRTLDAASVRLNGVILNAFDPKKARGQGGYSYGYSYRYDYKSRNDEAV